MTRLDVVCIALFVVCVGTFCGGLAAHSVALDLASAGTGLVVAAIQLRQITTEWKDNQV